MHSFLFLAGSLSQNLIQVRANMHSWASINHYLSSIFAGVPSVAQDNAALLSASSSRLGSLLAELYTAMPTLAACRFVASFGAVHSNHSALATHQLGLKSSSGAAEKDAVFVASAGIATKLGVDFDGLSVLLGKTKNVLTQISR